MPGRAEIMSALHDISPCLRVCTTILISYRDLNLDKYAQMPLEVLFNG